MKVSVVIPAHNEEKTIGKTLESLCHQTISPDEIIVVDNACTDKTAQIAHSFGVRVVREEVQGITTARNRGFNEAKYDIIARTDADSVVSPTWVEQLKKNFENSRVVAVSGPASFGSSFMLPIVKL